MWTSVIQQLIGLGLPILGNALGGPFGGMVAGMIAKAIGAPTATPEDIAKTIETTPNDITVQKLKSAEAEYVAMVDAQAKLGAAQTAAIAETIKAELIAAQTIGGRLGRAVQFMQMSWRPLFAYETLLECVGMTIVTAHEIWTADFSTLNSMLQFQGFMTWYFGLKFGLLGVYSIGRSAEKVNTDTQPIDDIVTRVIKAIRGKK